MMTPLINISSFTQKDRYHEITTNLISVKNRYIDYIGNQQQFSNIVPINGNESESKYIHSDLLGHFTGR